MPNRADGYRLVGDTVKHQEWVSPALNTTADGSLYLTVRDLARWAAALDHRHGAERAATWPKPGRRCGSNDGGTYPYGFGWMLDPVRGHARVGHTGVVAGIPDQHRAVSRAAG